MKIPFTIFLLLISVATKAQLYSSAFHAGWNVVTPLSDKDFTGKTSAAGLRVGYTKFINDKFAFGLEGSYSTLDDYIPRQTYEYPGGAYTTDFYTYLYNFSILANAQYYFVQGKNFIPYASLGMGISLAEYRILYNVYEDTDGRQGFVIRPEVGTLFRFNEYSNWGLKSSLSYDFAAIKSSYFDVDNFSGINFQLGVVFFTD